jgi:hypothetical protein
VHLFPLLRQQILIEKVNENDLIPLKLAAKIINQNIKRYANTKGFSNRYSQIDEAFLYYGNRFNWFLSLKSLFPADFADERRIFICEICGSILPEIDIMDRHYIMCGIKCGIHAKTAVGNQQSANIAD